ncbi:MAG: hypothetical protein U1F35_21215 [Steroidobacteraceae bacterium]
MGKAAGARTSSTDDLISMIVFPDSLKGWLIGYGFYENPASPDENHMGTDIGYLRLLFYGNDRGPALIYLWYLWAGSVAFRTLHRAQDDAVRRADRLLLRFPAQVQLPAAARAHGIYIDSLLLGQQDRFRCA